MRKLFASAVFLLSATVFAQTTTTDNLITNPTFVGTTGWTTTGAVGGNGPTHPALPANGNGYTFTYSTGTIAQTYAINQALANVGAGVQIAGFDYGFKYRFGCANGYGGNCENPYGPQDTLNATSTITSSTGDVLYTRYYALGANAPAPYSATFSSVDTQQRFNSSVPIANLGSFKISFTGLDAGYWGGNYGPTIKDVYSRAVYTVDPCVADPQSSPSCPGFKTYHTFTDDSWVNVPLQFPFPFYGQVFTNSFMFSNGVVGFMGVGQQPGDGFCCAGESINHSSVRFNYTIAPLNTDLYPQPNSVFWSQSSPEYQRYVWENISEISNSGNLNTFGVEIKPSGYIGLRYSNVNISQPTTSAIVGNAALGEYNMNFHGSNFATGSVPALIEYTGTSSICTSNPLASPNCPGYHDAQCAVNPLHAATCSGYQTAYFNQQCSNNPLYAATCPGYAVAYKNQQCSNNPLYATDCPGYAQAYLNDQCIKDSLYSTQCEGYKTAYAIKYLVNLDPAVTTAVNQQLTATVEIARADPANVVSATGDATTDTVLTTPITTSATSATSVTSVIAPKPASDPIGPPGAAPGSNGSAPPPITARSEEKQQDQKKTDGAVATVEKKSGGNREAAKKEATAQAKELANDMNRAATIEQQKANQGLVVGLMNYVPGFSAYQNSIIPDAKLYSVEQAYKNQRVIDNQRVLRQLNQASDRLHQEMVDEQYRR